MRASVRRCDHCAMDELDGRALMAAKMACGRGGAEGVLQTESGGTREGIALASTSGIPSATAELQQRTLKRAAVGLLVLIVMVTLGAWLLWASIDPDEASAAWSPEAGKVTEAQR
jgi:hypothetical protein